MTTCGETVTSLPSTETDRPATTQSVSSPAANNGKNSTAQTQLVPSPYIDIQIISGTEKVDEEEKKNSVCSPNKDILIIPGNDKTVDSDEENTFSSPNKEPEIISDNEQVEKDEADESNTGTVKSKDVKGNYKDSAKLHLGMNEQLFNGKQAFVSNGTHSLINGFPTRGRQVESTNPTERGKQKSVAVEMMDKNNETLTEDNKNGISNEDLKNLAPREDIKLEVPPDHTKTYSLKGDTKNESLMKNTTNSQPVFTDTSHQGCGMGKDQQVSENSEKEGWKNDLLSCTADAQKSIPCSQSLQNDPHMMDVNATEQAEYVQEYIYLASDYCVSNDSSLFNKQVTTKRDAGAESTPKFSIVETLYPDHDQPRNDEKPAFDTTSYVTLKVAIESNVNDNKNGEIKVKHSSKFFAKEAIDLLTRSNCENVKEETFREEASIVLQQVAKNSAEINAKGKAARAAKYVDLQNSMKMETIGRAAQNTHQGKYLPDNRTGRVNVLRQDVPGLRRGRVGENQDNYNDEGEEEDNPVLDVPRDVYKGMNSHFEVPTIHNPRLRARRGNYAHTDLPRNYNKNREVSRSYGAHLDTSRNSEARLDVSRSYDSCLEVPRKNKRQYDVSSSEESNDDVSISGQMDEDVNRNGDEDDATKTSVTLLVVSVVLLALVMSHPISANLIAVTVFFSLSKSSTEK